MARDGWTGPATAWQPRLRKIRGTCNCASPRPLCPRYLISPHWSAPMRRASHVSPPFTLGFTGRIRGRTHDPTRALGTAATPKHLDPQGASTHDGRDPLQHRPRLRPGPPPRPNPHRRRRPAVSFNPASLNSGLRPRPSPAYAPPELRGPSRLARTLCFQFRSGGPARPIAGSLGEAAAPPRPRLPRRTCCGSISARHRGRPGPAHPKAFLGRGRAAAA